MSQVYINILGLGNSTIGNHCCDSWSTTVITIVYFTIVVVVDMIFEWILQIIGHILCHQCLVYM